MAEESSPTSERSTPGDQKVRQSGRPAELRATAQPSSGNSAAPIAAEDFAGLQFGGLGATDDIERAAIALRDSEVRFSSLFAAAPMALFVCDRNAVIEQYNRRAVEIWGREPVCGVERHCGSTKLWLPDGTPLPHGQSPIIAVLRTGTPAHNVEVSIERPDGSRVPVLVNFAALRNAEGDITGAITSFVDITERKLAEELLSCQKQALEMVTKGEPLEAVLDFLARSMERQSKDEFLVALHLLEEDGHHFGHVSAPSLPASYARATRGMDARMKLGPCSTAVVAQTPTIVRDFAAEVRWPAFSADVVALGLRGCFTTPIVASDQRILGTVAIYYRQPRDPRPSDQRLVEIVTGTASIAIERRQTEKKLHESDDRFRAIAEHIPQLAWMADRDGNVEWFNRGWLDYTGTTLEDNVGAGWKAAHHPDHVDRVAEKFELHLREGRDWEDTFPLRGKDGAYRWFLSRMNAIRDESGNLVRFFGTNTDITREREADQHRELLIGELNHRVKNTLAIVQAIAVQTLGGRALSAEEARTAFVARLMMLAKAHDLLTQCNWQATDLASVVSVATEPLVHTRNSIRIEGPRVLLAPSRAVSFTMALHELATNAAKYGALSVQGGQVDVGWRLTGDGEDRRLWFQWAESGGPPVDPPSRQGFGSRMIERALAFELGGEVTLAYDPSGVVCVIDAPLPPVGEETERDATR